MVAAPPYYFTRWCRREFDIGGGVEHSLILMQISIYLGPWMNGIQIKYRATVPTVF